jgi:uncharacterized membrane protein YqjE
VSDAPRNGRGGDQSDGGPQNIATAITDVTERFTVLIHEEIELAKAEVTEKTTKLAKGAVVAVAAGIFLVTALFFVLIGLAFLLYYVFPVNAFAYFWGFFAMALILIVLGAIAGLIAAKVVKKGAPPVPNMAIDEARKIRESISAGGETVAGSAAPAAAAGVSTAPSAGAYSAPVSAPAASAASYSAPAPATPGEAS